MSKLFGPETMKDEYHKALKQGMARLQIIHSTRRQILGFAKTQPTVYMALAVLAYEWGDAALYEGIKIVAAFTEEQLKDIPF